MYLSEPSTQRPIQPAEPPPMPPCSPERLAANRRNALKSTGPKTVEGKERSRSNARKHGLTGDGIALPAEDAAVVAERFESLRDQFDPRTPMGGILCKRVAMLSVRLDRSYEHEAAALSVRVLSAGPSFADARKAEAEHLIHTIAAEPATNHRRLMASPEGVEIMIAQWERMRADLHDPEGCLWTYSHYQMADSLHGRKSVDIDMSPYMAWTMAMNGQYQYLRPDRLAGLKDDAAKKLHAMDKVVELVDADLARLRDLRATMDTSAVDATRAFAAKLALFDSSKEAVLARKYEAATERGLYRALKELNEVEAAGHSEAVTPDQVRESETVGSFFPALTPDAEAPEDAAEPEETTNAYPTQTPMLVPETGPVEQSGRRSVLSRTKSRR